ncbi:hypothetical protein TWF730_008784 [Orbilia blumenaviensis]|uniref:NACHT domain-containing protein n=1 Tax=Orbilia blumenaviensis TaxID=1796055 RepID=A0AAV9V9W4_9PEZI
MEGLGAAASVIAVIDISAKLLGALGNYLKGVKDAREDIERLTEQVKSLQAVLENIKILVDGKDETTIPGIQSLKDSLAQCKIQVEGLSEKLPVPDQKKSFFGLRTKHLKWPFKKTQVKEILDALESYKTTLSNSLAVNNLDVGLRNNEGVERANVNIKTAERRQKRQFLHSMEADEAAFNSNKQQHDPRCLENTRTELLNTIKSWATINKSPSIFWLRGMAGTGKSTISRTIAEKFDDLQVLGASFFFSRGDGDRGRITKFATTIASQLASRIDPFEKSLHEALDELESVNISGLDLKSQWSKLILEPLSNLNFGGGAKKVIVLVIDALDECGKEADAQLIVELLQSSAKMLQSVELLTYITSRPEAHINRAFNDVPNQNLTDVALHDISKHIVQSDIKLFLCDEFRKIGRTRSFPPNWITDKQIDALTDKSDGLFIYAATVCRFINDDAESPQDLLNTALEKETRGISTTPDLDDIYLKILKTAVLEKCRENQKRVRADKFKRVVGCLILLSRNFTFEDLASFLEEDVDSIRPFLRLLSSVLDMPRSNQEQFEIRLLHPSFRDFLLDRERCSDISFWIDERKTAKTMALRCIDIMKKTLRKDICNLGLPATTIEDIEDSVINTHIPETTKHACLYWVDYLKRSEIGPDDEKVHKFLKDHILHWFEALSLMKVLPESIRIIESLLLILGDSNSSPNLYSLVYDAKRFILHNRSIMEHNPLQIYSSCLLFSPKHCLIRKQELGGIGSWINITSELQEDWGLCVQSLRGHSSYVLSVAFSPDGKQLASGFYDDTVKIWDLTTGVNLNTLKGHSGSIQSVAFSPDGRYLASGSGDGTIKIWNTITGVNLSTLEDHEKWVNSVAFSPNGKRLASGSDDNSIKIWDMTTEAKSVIHTLEGHSEAVAFSPDGRFLASGSQDSTIKVWNTITGVNLITLKNHSDCVRSVAFSPDGKHLASGSDDNGIKIWDMTTEVKFVIHTLEGHSNAVQSVAFSPDGRFLASGSQDSTIKVWNTITGVNLITLKNHSDWVRSVAFSPDGKHLASGSDDNSIKIWDMTPLPLQSLGARPDLDTTMRTSIVPFEGHSGSKKSIAISSDGKRLASGFKNGTIAIWDTITGANLAIVAYRGDSDTIEPVSPDANPNTIDFVTFSPDGKQLAACCYGGAINIWDTKTWEISTTLKCEAISVAFSPNGKQLASESYDQGIQLWGIAAGFDLESALELSNGPWSHKSFIFSPDGNQLARCSVGDIQIWDTSTGASLATLDGRSSNVNSAAFSPDGKLLASCSDDRTIKIWDIITGINLATIRGHSDWVHSIAFSLDGEQLASGSHDNTIKFWDVTTAISSSCTQDGSVLRPQDALILPPSFQLNYVFFRADSMAIGTESGHLFLCSVQDSPKHPPPSFFQFDR